MKELIHDIAISGLEIRELLDIVKSNLKENSVGYAYIRVFHDISEEIVLLNQRIKKLLTISGEFTILRALQDDIVVFTEGKDETVNILYILIESLNILEKIIEQAYLKEDKNKDRKLLMSGELINELLGLIGAQSVENMWSRLEVLTIKMPIMDQSYSESQIIGEESTRYLFDKTLQFGFIEYGPFENVEIIDEFKETPVPVATPVNSSILSLVIDASLRLLGKTALKMGIKMHEHGISFFYNLPKNTQISCKNKENLFKESNVGR